jgi:hypothetical protein
MVFSICSPKQITKFSMETDDVSTTQEMSHVEITNEENVHHFLLYQGYCTLEFIPQGQIVNQAYCVEIVKLLYEAICRKMPKI